MKLLFIEAYEQYLIYIENKQKKQSKRTLKERFENKILPYWKNYDIYKIKEIDYMTWQNFIDKEEYSNNYRKGLHYLMTCFFDFCIKYYGIEKNIARLVGNFKDNNKIIIKKYYTYKEFKKFIKNVNNIVYKQFFILMFFTGTRPGEAMALKFSDLFEYYIDINKTIDSRGNREIGTPKTKSSYRKIAINKQIYKDLNKLKKYYEKKYKEFNDEFFIFGGIKPLSPTSIRRNIKKASLKAGVKYIKIHEFRHSHATLLNKHKIDMLSIKNRLGHSDISTTMNIYVNYDKSQEKRVIKTLSLIRLFKHF